MNPDDKPRDRCDDYELLIMRHFDRKTNPEDEIRLAAHLESCPSCRARMTQYERLFTAAADVAMRPAPPEYFETYWSGVYNRLERHTALFVLAAAVAAAGCYALVRLALFLMRAEDMSLWVKVAIAGLVIGAVLLFVSVLREKLTLRRTDKYRGVIR